jgi:nucleotide-binding universal stress UspA family protein
VFCLFKKILVAFDGSKQSEKGLKEALDISRKTGAGVTALYVEEHLPAPVRPNTSGFIVEHELEEMSEFEMAKAEAIVRRAKAKAKIVVVNGNPVQEITRFAEKGKFDLVVVGVHSVGAIRRLMLGSVSGEIVHKAHAAVLVVK